MKKLLYSALAIAALALASFAADFRPIPGDAAATLGYTHVCRVTYLDITNTTDTTLFRWPATGYAPQGAQLVSVGWYLSKPFSMSGWDGTSNRVDLTAGQFAALTASMSPQQLGSNYTRTAWTTNTIIGQVVISATQAFVSTLTFTNATAASLLTNGEVYIFYKIARPDRAYMSY
jgi:hypothetical protein